MILGGVCFMVLVAGACAGPDRWRWPDEARSASVRIDTKVRFVDDDSRRPNKVQADEIKPPLETEGFYNRAEGPGSGRYAVQTELQAQRLTHEPHSRAYSDGTLDSLQYCKCVSHSAPACHTPTNLPKACSTGKHLCCYKRSNRAPQNSQSELFSELEDERPMLLPSFERRPGPFGADPEDQHVFVDSFQSSGVSGYQNGRPSNQRNNGVLFGPGGPTGVVGPNDDSRILVGPSGPTSVVGPNRRNPGVLVGPDGPTGVIGPNHRDNRLLVGPNERNPGVLVGPEGPTGVIGPNLRDNRVLVGPIHRNTEVLVGPMGPTGIIGPIDRDNNALNGPHGSNQRNPGVLVGPGGPTGVIGPNHRDDRVFNGPSGFHRPHQGNPGVLVGPDGPTGNIGVPDRREPWVLVGPGGPTGEIGPDQHKQGVHSNQGAESAQVLVGPGGPTGIIGPGGRRSRWQTGPGILVGPGGPTGIIGPGQRLLVGPGGPTGRLGPRGYGQYGF